jgi:phage-related protein (TIGR01555 family)
LQAIFLLFVLRRYNGRYISPGALTMVKPKTPAEPKTELKKKGTGLSSAVNKALAATTPKKTYEFPVKPPDLAPGVVPKGSTAPVMATDSNPYSFAAQQFSGGGFPGFSYLSNLATRAEYRAFAAALSTEVTREWIKFTSKEDDDDTNAEKIKAIEEEFNRLNVRGVIQKAAEHDCLFGRGQIFIDVDRADRKTPLILDPRTVKKGSLKQIVPVEAVWTTPAAYNALDPVAPDFYKPSRWFMLGQEVHASRLMTIVTRELPDILKPAFNFAGISLSQLAEPYVDNWLRTRQSVADLINNFSITALATSMDQVLQGEDDGTDLFARATLFTATRSNKGLMLLDKDREDLVQLNVPLGGLHELQAQSQEHMCSVSRMPATVLTGIQPSGLNVTSDGETRAWYDWIAAQQESNYRHPLEVILQVVQLSLFGEIDPNIGISFNPLYQMTPKELSEIRFQDSQTAGNYIDRGVLDPSEERERLARDPDSGYQGLDAAALPVPPPDPGPGDLQPGAGG